MYRWPNLLVIAAFTLLLSGETRSDDVIQITRLDAIVDASTEPPPASAHWQSATLPFALGDSELTGADGVRIGSAVWFRFRMTASPDDTLISLLLWRHNHRADVFINGQLLKGDYHRSGYFTNAWNRPLLVDIQPGNWQAGDNEVHIRLGVTQWGGNLAPVLIGDSNTLFNEWRKLMLRQVEVNKLLLAFSLSLALVTLVLWHFRRQDTLYLWFAAMALCWSVITSHMVIYHNPVPFGIWLPLLHAAIDGCTFFMYGFIGRLTGTRIPFRERLFLAWTLVAVAIHFSVPPALFWPVAYSIHMVGVFALGAIGLRTAIRAAQQREITALIITGAMLLQVLLFSTNAAMMFIDRGDGWAGTLVYAHFGIPVLLFAFALALLKRFIDALRETEQLHDERMRIYRDLHDDVGSRLLSIIHADGSLNPGDLARNALESLRTAVARANTPEQWLKDFLKDLREEAELRLRGAGHQVRWQQAEVVPDIMLDSDTAFHLNRILKEVISNIIRHARADQVVFDFRSFGRGWELSVEDNGCGIPQPESGNGGNGMDNIRFRASHTGMLVQWQQATPGTRFILRHAFS